MRKATKLAVAVAAAWAAGITFGAVAKADTPDFTGTVTTVSTHPHGGPSHCHLLAKMPKFCRSHLGERC
jgi:hypothetical protein